MPYDLRGLIILLVLAGLGLWALTQFPLDATIAKLIRVVIVVVVCVYLLFWLMNFIPLSGGVPPRLR